MKYRNKYTWLVALFVAGGVMGAMACGGDDNNGGGGSRDGGNTNPGDSGNNQGDSGNNPPPPSGKAGSVTVVNSKSTSIAFFSASAAFIDATSTGGGTTSCTTTTDGSCRIVKCPKATSTADAGTPTAVSAGDISITGGKEDVKLPVRTDNTYKAVIGTSELYEGGEDITIAAAGASSGIGPFSQNLKAPSIVDVTAPAISGGEAGTLTIDRTKDLEVDWTLTGTGIGDVLTSVSAAASDGSTVSIICKNPAGDKKATISKSALGNIPDGASSGGFAVFAASNNKDTRSGYDVSLTLTSTATRDNGANGASAHVTFQ